MYINSAYLNNSRIDIKDKSKPLIVTSCGTYRLYTRPTLPTLRPRGRLDYQLIYIFAGKAHFFFGQKEEIVTAGHMVLYRPKEPQKYIYYLEDHTEVYWIHFTGGNVKNLIRSYGIADNQKIFCCGSSLEYQTHFRVMIEELQLCRDDYPEMLEMHLRQIFIMLHRHQNSDSKVENSMLAEEMDKAMLYFNKHYCDDICIEEYASSIHMSTSWFIRNFKQYTGQTPMQYILSIRIINAENLLETTDYNLTEISRIIGYDNPLYFSRIFKKQKGISPSEYRKNIKKST